MTWWSRLRVVAALLLSAAAVGGSPALASEPQPIVHEDPICAFDGTACVGTIHFVSRGEWLWKIARAEMVRQGASSRDVPAVRRYVAKIYLVNRAVIGHNPNRLRIGARLILPSVR